MLFRSRRFTEILTALTAFFCPNGMRSTRSVVRAQPASSVSNQIRSWTDGAIPSRTADWLTGTNLASILITLPSAIEGMSVSLRTHERSWSATLRSLIVPVVF